MLTGIGSGICWHHWFGFEQQVVDELTAGMQEGSALLVTARTALGIALEQFVMIPFYFSLYLIPVVSLQNGVIPSGVPAEVKDKLPGLFLNNAKVCTSAAQTIPKALTHGAHTPLRNVCAAGLDARERDYLQPS